MHIRVSRKERLFEIRGAKNRYRLVGIMLSYYVMQS